MAILSLTPNLGVKDVNNSVDFYRDHLGFELVMSVPDTGKLQWAMLKQGDAVLMLHEKSNLAEEYPDTKDKPIGGALTFYLETDNFDALYASIKEKVTIVKEPNTTFYGRKEFAIKDVDGYILIIAEK